MSALSRSAPVNQKIRINLLRAAFLCAIPLMVLTRSAWPDEMQEGLEILGLAFVIAGVLGRFWAMLYIGGHKNSMVMQDGPYSICRHPLYLFSTMGVLGLGLMLGSLVLTLVLGLLTFAILSITARKEEGYLRHSFGPAYDDYAARVPMILPRLSGFRTAPMIEVSVAHLRTNLMDALVFLLFIPFAELLREVVHIGAFRIW